MLVCYIMIIYSTGKLLLSNFYLSFSLSFYLSWPYCLLSYKEKKKEGFQRNVERNKASFETQIVLFLGETRI